ncbi:DUF6431 domain-containing protein [Amycolatopsis cynarae]|uniref:DUF6431 domain-containing protein n=1 Tax=Amycolatopsis cynarae TaxID=2995223 RepID=A0ABY7AYA6_9PSEU|nr:DUF6431 domain-containing protein [Amycolatopsis sp. HUAS 11-8]WAL63922.1 DUF6431 domain-containing protein [Amycolatopsis sp. HUAS 11-8]
MLITRSTNRSPVLTWLREGRLRCPGCHGPLRPWGYARVRTVRFARAPARLLRPRRLRCRGCGSTHVVLPDWVLPRRAYAAPVVKQALAGRSAGHGHRAVAARLRIPAPTVRDWFRLPDHYPGWATSRGHSAVSARVLSAVYVG